MPNDNSQSPRSLLFTPIELRGVRLKNRVVISPMCQYSAQDGFADDWHLVHLGRFATGGAGLIFTEASAIEERARITHGDLGIWKDEHIAALRRITAFIKANGAMPAIQLAHAGRKASMQRPWYGNGPLGDDDFARGDRPWETIAPSAEPIGPAWIVPHEISRDAMRQLLEAWRQAARRSLAAGYEAIEVHGAHGYLLHTFLSPLANKRSDEYGGSLQNRMRFALEVAEAVRAVWPQDKPVLFRASATDYADGGWTLDDTITLARELKALGIDVIDCSSGGIAGSATAANIKRFPGFQVPFAERVRR
jgi:2,4-dienoyl-CoA reductase-like NADH-dependent reductase (Old Yellow Enzyme family)